MSTSPSEFHSGLDPFEQPGSFPWQVLFSGVGSHADPNPPSLPAANQAGADQSGPHPTQSLPAWDAFPEPRTIPSGWDLSSLE